MITQACRMAEQKKMTEAELAEFNKWREHKTGQELLLQMEREQLAVIKRLEDHRNRIAASEKFKAVGGFADGATHVVPVQALKNFRLDRV